MLVLLWHSLCKLSKFGLGDVDRGVVEFIKKHGLHLVHLAIATRVLLAESICVAPQPQVIGTGLAGPGGARVVDHGSLANILFGADVRLELALTGVNHQFVAVKNMVCS
jgi:hypothetical protein